MMREAGLIRTKYAPTFHRLCEIAAAAERKKMQLDGIHTCSNECQRPACVAVRKAVKAEREACAKVCDDELERLGWDANVADVVREIRARGNK
jgi:hypothetical protein